MTADRSELYELVGELPDDQVASAMSDLRQRVRGARPTGPGTFDWIGMAAANNGQTDNAEQVDELLAGGFGRR